MSFRLTHVHDYNRFVAIDLGYHRVRASVYDVSNGSPQCLGFGAVRQSRKNFTETSISDISGLSQIIEQAIIQAGVKVDAIPDNIIMNLSSRAFVFDTLATQYIRADPESTLTMQEIDSMIKLIEKESTLRAQQKYKNTYGIPGDDLRLVSSTLVSIMIDGKKITNPIGFSGHKIRLMVLNVFMPAGEFNIARSLLSHLGKKTISLIPTPLILPKLVEQTEYCRQNVCYIDVGYMHTTLTLVESNEITRIEVLPYGTEMLFSYIRESTAHLSILQIENAICSIKRGDSVYQEYLQDFLLYLQDAIFGYLQNEHLDIRFESILLHGSIFQNDYILGQFSAMLDDVFVYSPYKARIHEVIDRDIPPDQCITQGLAIMAQELFLVKKDPLVRILRYVLYQYE